MEEGTRISMKQLMASLSARKPRGSKVRYVYVEQPCTCGYCRVKDYLSEKTEDFRNYISDSFSREQTSDLEDRV